MSDLETLHGRLEAHFQRLRQERDAHGGGKPLFALEHGLDDDAVAELQRCVRGAIRIGRPSHRWWLPNVVYAAEVGYRYTGDEYWHTFEITTPGWVERGDRHYIRQKFGAFAERFGGAEPTGPWASHFSIICWPITHAVLPTDLQIQLARLLYEYHGVNAAGCCAGPFQFNLTNGPPSTWDTHKLAYPHERAPHPSVYDDFDAAMAAGALLLDGAVMSIHLLTPAYYESHFCLGELGAAWIRQIAHVPLIVPPVSYAALDGVQLGEQALRIDRASDLDELRDAISAATGVSVPTGQWNRQRDRFLNLWDAEFRGAIAEPSAVSREAHRELEVNADDLRRQLADASADRDRLRRFSQDLRAQNDELRMLIPSAPIAPVLEGDPILEWARDAVVAVQQARECMVPLPRIARESLYRLFFDGLPIPFGGYDSEFDVAEGVSAMEEGWVSRVEDADGLVTARTTKPEVESAYAALRRVREVVFNASSMDTKAEAPTWARPFLKQEFGVDDPNFDLRPVWEALGLL